jgi:hypothetical protein
MIKLKGTHKYQESIIRILINQQFGLSAYKYVKLELVNPLLKMIDESDNGSTWMRWGHPLFISKKQSPSSLTPEKRDDIICGRHQLESSENTHNSVLSTVQHPKFRTTPAIQTHESSRITPPHIDLQSQSLPLHMNYI